MQNPVPVSSLLVNFSFSCVACFVTIRLIPHLEEMFVKARLFGIDLNKTKEKKIPEAFGVVAGCIYLIVLFLFIPVPFVQHIADVTNFPHHEFVEMIAALLSICCMLLLGFADDVLDLRWRHKLLLPTVASLPLLAVYFVNINSTTIIVPKPVRNWLGHSIDLGVLYYIYMGMLAVFCTNAINIVAGVNGLEVGQSVIIAISILIFNVHELEGYTAKSHILSLYFLMPFIAVSVALLFYNWYPSKIFVGDTYCYFAGMTFAVVAILGHFSKTVILFFLPQIFNFLYSLPQLFHLLPCPRHRMPRLDKSSGLLQASCFEFSPSEVSAMGSACLKIFHKFRIIRMSKLDNEKIRCNNLTIINLMLLLSGPTHEQRLTLYLLLVQVVCSAVAFAIRYPLASLFYDV